MIITNGFWAGVFMTVFVVLLLFAIFVVYICVLNAEKTKRESQLFEELVRKTINKEEKGEE